MTGLLAEFDESHWTNGGATHKRKAHQFSGSEMPNSNTLKLLDEGVEFSLGPASATTNSGETEAGDA